ncbi:MAG: hypothetical protein Q7J78_01955, partial [Clostridiales bacterium]|nr:hypothetical protein [Clostridiales bacterium]
GPWKGYDFKSARNAYDTFAGRSYDDAKVAKKSVKDVCPTSLEAKCKNGLVIICDDTASMGDWTATIVEKLPLLDLEMEEYLEHGEVSFAACGDAYHDTYPLQVQKFGKGTDLKKNIEGLIIENGGGPGYRETYSLAGLYYARNVKLPEAEKSILIFIGDEGLYDIVNKEHAKQYAHVSLNKDITTEEVMKELQKKYAVYIIRKAYALSEAKNALIQKQWESYLGADHVVNLPEARRVVDVTFGILAEETGKTAYFNEELKQRQKPEQVKTVLEALKTVHVGPKLLPDPGKSVIKRAGNATRTKSILDE